MIEIVKQYSAFCKKQKASELCNQLSYTADSLGQFHKHLDPTYNFSHHTSELYAYLVETGLIYAINQQKTFGQVAKEIDKWLSENA